MYHANASEVSLIDEERLSDGTTRLKIHFNYMDVSLTKTKVKNAEGVFDIHIPLPNKWEIIDAKGYIKYDPSTLLMKDLSTITLSFNDVLLAKYKLFDHIQEGIRFSLNPDLFMKDNYVVLDISQHYTQECENSIDPALWTEIDLANSYIELHVRPKALKEEIASIEKNLFDHTQYHMTPVNYVMHATDKNTLRHFALFTSILSTKLNQRLLTIQVSDQIDPKAHNIIIATKQKAKEYLSLFNEVNSSNKLNQLSFENRLTHDINVIQNPYYINKTIIAITPEDSSKIDEIIYAIYKNDLSQYKEQGLNITNKQIPPPSKAYSAKNFVPVDQKIYFKELGFNTTLLKGWYPPKVKVKFKVYPDHYFNSKDMIETHIHYLFPTLVHQDSLVDLYMNNVFVDQVNIIKSAKEADIKMDSNKLFNFDSKKNIPSLLLNKGINELKLDLSLVALRDNECDSYHTDNLIASVMDDSYFILPKSKRWIELPYMQLITDAQYPYAIYPDLQDTVIYLTNTNPDTISSAMNFIYFLTQEIGSFPTHISFSTKISPQDEQKSIIVLGTIEDQGLQTLSKNAPIEFENDAIKTTYPGLNNFIKEENLFTTNLFDKYQLLTSIKGPLLPENTLVMQMYRSFFNPERSILLFTANDSSSLNNGVHSLLKHKNRDNMEGDLLLYDYKKEKGVTFNIKDKYILSKLNWYESLLLKIGFNPLTYMILFFLILFIMVSIIKLYLKKFEEEHHPHA